MLMPVLWLEKRWTEFADLSVCSAGAEPAHDGMIGTVLNLQLPASRIECFLPACNGFTS